MMASCDNDAEFATRSTSSDFAQPEGIEVAGLQAVSISYAADGEYMPALGCTDQGDATNTLATRGDLCVRMVITNTTATTQRNPNVAWGTQYDWLSTRYATYDDIRNYDSGQIRVLKNSIYARHGRRFKDANLRKYFNSQPWYNPRYDEVPAKQFNKYENANIAFLKKYEK